MMGKLKITIVLFFFLCASVANAYVEPKPDGEKPKTNTNTTVSFRADCTNATAQTDMDINNVRARLLNGGDVWWDLDNGSYFVPKAPIGSGLIEVSSIFAGAVWLGGLDPAGNLKMAAVQYRQNGNTDFYSGPLDPETGLTDKVICDNWDRFFRVYGDEIRDASARYEQFVADGTPFTEDQLADNVKYWPAKGNPFFLERYNFELPSTGQGLGSFWDEDFSGDYNPLAGDFPIIEIRGCEPENRQAALELLPDDMHFWIYNDAGGPHNESNGSTAIQMEIQVQAFAYATNDEINDMTFQRYKLINRASEDIRDTYFAMWVDFDLGCSEDDLIGCDVSRSLAYCYNLDAQDGDSGTNCSTGGGATYENNIPIVGTDYFRGPLEPRTYVRDMDGNVVTDPDTGDSLSLSTVPGGEIDFFEELGMSSFMYINRQNSGPTESWTFDPTVSDEYYNYLRGFWRDGRAVTAGGCGFTVGNTDTIRYVFPGLPERDNEWSMCTQCQSEGDRRTLQASGPFLLTPGAVNELIIGVVWVPDMDYPCPDISRFTAADDLAQGLFDNCFNLLDGPDAPDVCAIELDKEIILVLSNDSIGTSNNKFEEYSEGDPLAPSDLEEGEDQYIFEGYKVYQLINAQISPSEYDDIDKARLVQVVDINNGITELVNWTPQSIFGQAEEVWIPETEVEALDSGVKHTFQITTDQFASGDQSLVNHKKYYFSVIAYAQNNWQDFIINPDDDELRGQRTPYLEGRRNIEVYTVIPRPIVYENLNAQYGEGIQISRLSGVGIGGNFVQLAEGSYDAILDGSFDGKLTYAEGAGPIEVNIYNPLEVRDGTYKVRVNGVHDGSANVCALEAGARWELEGPDGRIIASEKSIDALNEQIIPQYGISLSIAQTEDSGAATTDDNGTIGASLVYDDLNGNQWYAAVRDDGAGIPLVDIQPFFRPTTNFLKTSSAEVDNFLDPTEAFGNMGSGYWYPYYLTTSIAPDPIADVFPYYVTPAWDSQGFIRSNNGLDKLNNVDIIFTNDKSKWSRCIVVETNNGFFRQNSLRPEGDNNTDMFDLRQSPSVDQNGAPDGDGLGMGWFPGYAIDVETGERLNIFFGENSYFDEEFQSIVVNEDVANGRDMLFNPNDETFVIDTAGTQTWFASPQALYAGGQHMIYVTRTAYDECEALRGQITENTGNGNLVGKINVLRSITWTSIPLVNADVMLPYSDGYIPNDLTVQLRVQNPYSLQEEFNLQVATACSPIGELPEYEFTLSGTESVALTTDEYEGALANVNVVPNPYYGYSAYETSQFTTTVKVTNLPSRAEITIYSLDGKFIKQFSRNEIDPIKTGSNPGIIQGQGTPDVEWDLKNFKGIPIASGVYLIHIVAPDLGEERTIKWFGVNRKFDPSGL